MFSKARMIISLLLFVCLCLVSYADERRNWKVIDESYKKPIVADVVKIDNVWAGHQVSFCLLTSGQHQFVAYYNAQRKMIAGMRMLDDKNWILFELKSGMDQHPRFRAGETSTILGWDSHNYITMAIDDKGFIHLSGNMHCNGLTYFRSQRPYDVTTLVQIDKMVGKDEARTTYPKFIKTPDGRFIFHYRTGESGNGNEIYNIYDVNSQQWSRLFDVPLTNGKGHMNAYLLDPVYGPDDWFHESWVWRTFPDANSNQDLSYMKSPDLINWYDVDEKKLNLPVVIDTNNLIVDPIPVCGGIINGSGKVGFDNKGRAVLAYHKFDEKGNTQAYCARYENEKWKIYKLTDWDYRWDFGGGGSIENEVNLGNIIARSDGLLELSYSHKKYGSGCWLLDSNDFSICGKVIKPQRLPKEIIKIRSDFPGMQVRSCVDKGDSGQENVKYVLRWETLGVNRDLAREGALPAPSELLLYKIKYETP